MRALEKIKKESECYEGEYPRIRIGHAIHSVDEETVALMKEMGVGVELNLVSNLKLGNIKSIEDGDVQKTIQLCQKNGIPIFLGTDGYGIYQTSPEEQLNLAKKAGVEPLHIIISENEYIQEQRNREQKERKKLSNSPKGIAKSRIEEKLRTSDVHIAQSQDDSRLKGKIPIVVAGGSFKTRGDGSFYEYQKVALALQVLADVIKPGACYFATGGTNCGPERFLHSAIENRDKSNSKSSMKCVGIIPSYLGRFDDENAMQDFDAIKPKTISDGIIVDSYNGWNGFAEKLMMIANNSFNNEKQRGTRPNGFCIFIGGGETVRTEIRLACNGGKYTEPVHSFCFNGFGNQSASKRAIEIAGDSENITGFFDAESLITQIYKTYGKDIFINKFDINKLPLYIEQAKKRVVLDYQLFYETLLDEGKYTEGQLDMVKKMVEFGNTADISQCFGKSKDLDLFVSAYSTYIKEKSSKEIPTEFTADLRSEDIEKCGEVLKQEVYKKQEQGEKDSKIGEEK